MEIPWTIVILFTLIWALTLGFKLGETFRKTISFLQLSFQKVVRTSSIPWGTSIRSLWQILWRLPNQRYKPGLKYNFYASLAKDLTKHLFEGLFCRLGTESKACWVSREDVRGLQILWISGGDQYKGWSWGS